MALVQYQGTCASAYLIKLEAAKSKVGDQIRESLDAKLILNTVKVLGSIPSVELVGNDA